MHPADWTVAAGAVPDVLRDMEDRLRRRRRRRLAAASGIGAAGLIALALFSWPQPRPEETRVAGDPASSAIVSLPRKEILPDGSTVELRNGAEVAVEYTPTHRRVELRKGEAHFMVKPGPLPFVVRAAGVDVRAVGTAFSVQLGHANVEVLVTEGRVAVESAGPVAAPVPGKHDERRPLAIAEAGTRVVVPAEPGANDTAAASVLPIAGTDLAERLAWRAARLEFSRTPLAEALDIISEHTPPDRRVRVRFASPAIAQVAVSGVLRADNLDMLLLLLREEHGIVAEHPAPREIVLRQ